MIIRLAGLGSKKLKFSFCTYSNDPSSRKIKENLRKLNKKRIDLVEIILECSGWGRSPIARTVSTGGPPVACSSCSPGPRFGRSYCSWLCSLNKKTLHPEKKSFLIFFKFFEKVKKNFQFSSSPPPLGGKKVTFWYHVLYTLKLMEVIKVNMDLSLFIQR